MLRRTWKFNEVEWSSDRLSYIHLSCISTCIIDRWYSKVGRLGGSPRDPKRHRLSRVTPFNFAKYKARKFAPPPTHGETTCGWTRHVRLEHRDGETDRHHSHEKTTARHCQQGCGKFPADVFGLGREGGGSWIDRIARARTLPFPLQVPKNFVHYFMSRSRECAGQWLSDGHVKCGSQLHHNGAIHVDILRACIRPQVFIIVLPKTRNMIRETWYDGTSCT